LENIIEAASIIFAAGRGSRMKGFDGNKALLPLSRGSSPYEGRHPILLHILSNLPAGPKAIVVHYRQEDIMRTTEGLDLVYCHQPRLNGTGGALLAGRRFLEKQDCARIIVTMGDVPFVRLDTYLALIDKLQDKDLVVLGFRPASKKQYGVLETKGDSLSRIIEWKYWSTFPEHRQQAFQVCNSGIYACKKEPLLHYLSVLESRPHKVQKEINGKPAEVEEFFITDLIGYMYDDGSPVGYVTVENEEEVMGVDDLPALLKAQEAYKP
jgi:bifunctional UDP-N-acetylglucosamine pyrophosphorylase/glucosamine-1-phosphate N-acetyltransferase